MQYHLNKTFTMREKKKTELRISKSGKRYWINPELYYARLQKEKDDRIERGQRVRGYYNQNRLTPYCHDNGHPTYMKYWEKKKEIRDKYPDWKSMSREEWLEYYTQVINLIYTDTDYLQYREETKTLAEREDDKWWEEKKLKEGEYDGTNDDY